jgi:uncharacterized membrane protein YgaE (UPF0421/DUF939 family)
MRTIPFNIGLRTIKTAIAVSLSIYLSQLLKLEYPYFVAMTAIISMDRTARLSITIGKNRVIGTFIGAIIGVLFASIDRGNPILAGIGILIIILISNQLNLPGSITVGGFVFVAIMVHIAPNISPFFYGLHRTLDSLFGAFIAFVVNLTFMPGYSVKRLDDNLNKFYPTLKDTLNQIDTITLEDFKSIYKSYQAYLDEALLYKDDVISKKSHESLNNHLVQLIQYEQPLKKLELYLTSSDPNLKLILRNQIIQVL